MNNRKRGFTIVELLIVIVVIAILAAITIVAYNGIQDRARDSETSSDLNKLGKSIEMFNADNGRYPTGDPEFKTLLTNAGYWEITRNSHPQLKRFIYCVNATNTAIVRMSAYGEGVNWSVGAERPTWSRLNGLATPLATTDSVYVPDVCADVGVADPTYRNWSGNLT